MGRARGRGRKKPKTKRLLKPVRPKTIRIGSAPRPVVTVVTPRFSSTTARRLRPRKPKPPLFGRGRTGTRGRQPIRTKPKGRLVSVRTKPFRTKPTRVTVASPSGREGRTITVSSRSILARGGKPSPRPTFASLIPFQAQPPKSTRGQLRSRGTPQGRKTTKRLLTTVRQRAFKPLQFPLDELGQIGRRIGDTSVRQIVEGLPIVAVGRKISKTKFKSDDPPFSEFGSDFDVLNFFG